VGWKQTQAFPPASTVSRVAVLDVIIDQNDLQSCLSPVVFCPYNSVALSLCNDLLVHCSFGFVTILEVTPVHCQAYSESTLISQYERYMGLSSLSPAIIELLELSNLKTICCQSFREISLKESNAVLTITRYEGFNLK
jgi:hypothetical protein